MDCDITLKQLSKASPHTIFPICPFVIYICVCDRRHDYITLSGTHCAFLRLGAGHHLTRQTL